MHCITIVESFFLFSSISSILYSYLNCQPINFVTSENSIILMKLNLLCIQNSCILGENVNWKVMLCKKFINGLCERECSA
jgi:hypothetical protein